MPDRDSVHLIKHIGDGAISTITGAERGDYFGVPCLVGKSTSCQASHWTEGATAYVALSEIQSVVVFASVVEYRAALERNRRRREASADYDHSARFD